MVACAIILHSTQLRKACNPDLGAALALCYSI